MSDYAEILAALDVDHMRMRRLRRLKEVPRWNAVPTIRDQRVDSHSFHVAWISLWVRGHLRSSVDIPIDSLLVYALFHDEPEAVTGDIPSPAKRVIGKALSEFEATREFAKAPDPITKLVVKVADCLEALIFVKEEQVLGNGGLRGIYKDISAKLRAAWDQLGPQISVPWDGDELLAQLWAVVHPEHHPVLDEIEALPEGDIPF